MRVFWLVFLWAVAVSDATWASDTLFYVGGTITVKGGGPLPAASIGITPILGFDAYATSDAGGHYAARVEYPKSYVAEDGCSSYQYNPATGTYSYQYYSCNMDNAVNICSVTNGFYPSCTSDDIDIDSDILAQNFELEEVVNPSLPPGACKVEGISYETNEVAGKFSCALRTGRHSRISAPSPMTLTFPAAKAYCAGLGGNIPSVTSLQNMPTHGGGWRMQLNFDDRLFYWGSAGRAHYGVRLTDKNSVAVQNRTLRLYTICLLNPL